MRIDTRIFRSEVNVREAVTVLLCSMRLGGKASVIWRIQLGGAERKTIDEAKKTEDIRFKVQSPQF
ncbi:MULTISPECIES: hypothetical protein [unclassified Ochrobactrum]|uniref:hypothetical protein n=1 Tax=Brucella/Ochrobactrum group TaxID=2826938 RepID=UPI0011166941|nr:hypothetical protein [Ochrobactrum sp. P6BSIII]